MLSHKSFLAFLYWFGVRKAEGLERTKEDFLIRTGLLIVDATPKKGGEREPLEISVDYPYADLIIEKVKITKRSSANKEGRVWNFSPAQPSMLLNGLWGTATILIFSD